MPDKPSKSWVFTINNYTTEHLDLLSRWNSEEFVTRLTVTKEVGESGTPHLQGAVTFKVAKRFAGLKKMIASAHWEAAVAKDAALYCLKEGSQVFINENYGKQGQRSDLAEAVVKIRSGVRPQEAMDPGMYMNYGRRGHEIAREVRADKARAWAEPREVFVYWGKSGTGKTRKAIAAGATKVKWVNNFMLGYRGESSVVFDDFDPSLMPRDIFLTLTDRYPDVVNVKGGEEGWLAKTIYFTSNFNPVDWYADWEGPSLAVQRRLTGVEHFQ